MDFKVRARIVAVEGGMPEQNNPQYILSQLGEGKGDLNPTMFNWSFKNWRNYWRDIQKLGEMFPELSIQVHCETDTYNEVHVVWVGKPCIRKTGFEFIYSQFPMTAIERTDSLKPIVEWTDFIKTFFAFKSNKESSLIFLRCLQEYRLQSAHVDSMVLITNASLNASFQFIKDSEGLVGGKKSPKDVPSALNSLNEWVELYTGDPLNIEGFVEEYIRFHYRTHHKLSEVLYKESPRYENMTSFQAMKEEILKGLKPFIALDEASSALLNKGCLSYNTEYFKKVYYEELIGGPHSRFA